MTAHGISHERRSEGCGACAWHAASSPRELEEASRSLRQRSMEHTGELNQTKALTRMSSAKDPPASAGIVSGTALRLEGKTRSKA